MYKEKFNKIVDGILDIVNNKEAFTDSDLQGAVEALLRKELDYKPYNSEEVIKKFDELHPNGVDLCYVDYNDELTDEQIQMLLRDRSLYEDDNFSRYVFENQDYTMNDIYEELRASTEYELEDISSDDYLREYIEDKNTSNQEKDLLRHTRAKLFTYIIPGGEDLGVRWNAGDDEKEEAKEKIFKLLNIAKTEDNIKAIDELLANAMDNSNLEIIFYTSPSNIIDLKDPMSNVKTIIFENPSVALVDRFSGSAYDVKIGEIITLPFKADCLFLDSQTGCYSLDKICGLYLPYYETKVTLK